MSDQTYSLSSEQVAILRKVETFLRVTQLNSPYREFDVLVRIDDLRDNVDLISRVLSEIKTQPITAHWRIVRVMTWLGIKALKAL